MKISTSLKHMMLAVFLFVAGQAAAQTVLLYEDFAKCTGTDEANSSIKDGVMDDNTTTAGFVGSKCYAGAGMVKLGTSSKAGQITTPALDLSDASATYTLTFKACAWKGDATSLLVSVDDQEAVTVEGLSNAAAPYANNLKEFSLQVSGTSASTITFASLKASKGRFWIDDIKVTKLAGGETPDPAVSTSSAVAFPTVKVGTTFTKSIVLDATALTADLTVAIEGEAFSCATQTLSKDEANGASLEITFAPAAEGEYTGTLTISGGGMTENIVVELSGAAQILEGEGSKENPYTIDDVAKLNNPVVKGWVKGYIVGYVVNSGVAVLNVDEEERVATNILMYKSAEVGADTASCVSIQLPTGMVRAALNLSNNPELLGKEVMVYGSLEAYYGFNGVKSVTEYEWLTAPAAITYTKATKIESGKGYVIGAVIDGEVKIATPISSGSYGYLKVDSADVNGSSFTLTTKAYEFVFTAVEDGYTITDALGKILYLKGTYNSFNIATEATSGHVWEVLDNADGSFDICNVEMEKTIQFDPQYNSYGAYDELKGVMPYLFEVSNGVVDGIESVEAIDEKAEVVIYNLSGQKVGNNFSALKSGVYVVKRGNKAQTVIK